ncbi:MAG: hypothetical protein O3A00_04270 [Planctomycetota bacterium]|nr:hypothetical protein [Planctomycetota bacterium]
MPTQSRASWAYVPQEVRIMQADIVVAGTITKTGKDVVKNGTTYAVGVIKPMTILKGKPKGEIRVAWPAPRPGGLQLSTTIIYKVGQAGVWVLTADETLDVHWATYPTDYQPLAKLPDVKQKLANLKAIQWSKAQAGLQVAMIIEQRDLRNSKIQVNGKPVKAVAQLAVYPLFKNASDKSLHVVDHFPDQPMSFVFHGPDGKEIAVDLYGKLPKRDMPPRKHNFVELPANEVRMIGYGFQLPMCLTSGTYSVALAYKNERDGQPLKIDGVWKGTLKSTTMRVGVPEKNAR